MIQIVTDSASMLPDDIRRRFAVSVVPLTITIDTQDFAEGVDLATAEVLDDGGTIQDAAAASERTATGTGSLIRRRCSRRGLTATPTQVVARTPQV